MRWWWELDRDGVAGSYLSARDDDAHDPHAAHEIPVFVV